MFNIENFILRARGHCVLNSSCDSVKSFALNCLTLLKLEDCTVVHRGHRNWDVGFEDTIFSSVARVNRQIRYVSQCTDNSFCDFLLSLEDSGYSLKRIHLYNYKGVIRPRRIHFDSTKPMVKVFVNIADDQTYSHGLYSYLPFSHLLYFNFLSKFISLALSRVDVHSILPIFKPFVQSFPLKSWQALATRNDGFHGDLPAADQSKKKKLLVFTYSK